MSAISLLVYAQYAVNFDGTTKKVTDPATFWESNATEIRVALGTNGGGDAVGAASAVSNNVMAFADATGKVIKDSGLAVSNVQTKVDTVNSLASKVTTNVEVTALSGMSATGLVARTGAGAFVPRTITGDTEIVVNNGNGVSGNPALTIGAAIARVAAIAAGYQPLATILTRLTGIGLGTSGDTLIRDATGWTNLPKSTDGKVFTLVGGLPAWADPTGGTNTGSGNADTNSANAWAAQQTFLAATVFGGDVSMGHVDVASFATATPIGFASGGHGASNAESARVALGVVPDVDVQAYSALLKKAATNTWSNYDLLLFNNSTFEALATTAAGRDLLAAISAAAQRQLLNVGELSQDAYGPERNGETNKTPSWDAIFDLINGLVIGSNLITSVEPPLLLTNGVLSLNTNGLGGGSSGGSGGGVTWLTNEGPSAYVGLNVSTNWPVLNITISSNDLPTAIGKFLFGYSAGVLSNASGSTISTYYNVDVNGVRVFRDLYQPSTSSSRGKFYSGQFLLLRESSNTASFVQLGSSHVPLNPDLGYAGDAGSSGQSFSLVATNITVDWSSNVTLSLKWECGTTTLGSPTNANAGFTKIAASLLKYNEGVTNTPSFSPTISSPVEGQAIVYDGTTWRNSPVRRMEMASDWVEHFSGIFGGAANEAIALGEWTSTTISGGTKALVGTYAGRNGVWQASGAPAAISGGAAIYHNGAILIPTNTLQFRADVILVLTNSLMLKAGYTDTGSSTNLATDACSLILTNGIVFGEACQGGFANRTQTATSFQCSSNTWYVMRVYLTNSVAWFRVFTNKTQLAWEDSVNSNVPNNTQLVGVGITAISNASDSTNKVLVGVDTIGHGYSVQ